MRTLMLSAIQQVFSLSNDEIYWLVLENPKYYREFILSLKSQLDKEDDFFTFYKDEKKDTHLEDYAFMVDNPLNFSLDDKKINATIQKNLQTNITPYEREDYYTLINLINEFIDKLTYDYPIQLTYDRQLGLAALLKAVSVQYEPDIETVLEYIIHRIKILNGVFGYDIFFIFNLYDYLTKDEMIAFHQEMCNLELNYIIISSHLPSYEIDQRSIVIIDKDLCEIHIESKSQKM